MTYANVISSGNSAVVTLPKRFREQNGIKVGDKVRIGFPTASMMTVEAIGQPGPDKKELLLRLRDLARENGKTRFPQTKEEERDMLGGRDA